MVSQIVPGNEKNRIETDARGRERASIDYDYEHEHDF
jgi:hypothetical protein